MCDVLCFKKRNNLYNDVIYGSFINLKAIAYKFDSRECYLKIYNNFLQYFYHPGRLHIWYKSATIPFVYQWILTGIGHN